MTTPKTPEGWQMVPKEPTHDMIQVAVEHLIRDHDEDQYRARGQAIAAYMDMLAAAPAAPSAEGVGSDGLHAAIMNLPCTVPANRANSSAVSYEQGHRDARHAAAELVAAAPTAPAGGEAPAEASDAQLMIVAQEMGLWCEAYTAPRESGVATELDITPEDAAEFNAASLKDIRAALKAAGLYTHPSADLRGAAEQALEALKDMNNGWKYIRRSHGDLYGVGWDRAQDKADAAIASLEAAISRKGKTE